MCLHVQDSLGGNAKTFILGNVSSAPGAVKETISTLRFLQSAKCIRNAVCFQSGLMTRPWSTQALIS